MAGLGWLAASCTWTLLLLGIPLCQEDPMTSLQRQRSHKGSAATLTFGLREVAPDETLLLPHWHAQCNSTNVTWHLN